MQSVNFIGEFSYDLICAIPYAYWLKENKLLKSTSGAKDSTCLYYFSQNHRESSQKRESVDAFGCPNLMPQAEFFDESQWIPPPYKKVFKNEYFSFDKPVLVVSNTYTGNEISRPVNFIALPTLNKILLYLKDRYSIIYSRPTFELIPQDGTTKMYELGDFNLIKNNHKDILLIQDMYRMFLEKYPNTTFNTFQMYLYSSCDNFISVNGGSGALASYFGGRNIIYAEFSCEAKYGHYNGYYKRLGNSDIRYAANQNSFLDVVKKTY